MPPYDDKLFPPIDGGRGQAEDGDALEAGLETSPLPIESSLLSKLVRRGPGALWHESEFSADGAGDEAPYEEVPYIVSLNDLAEEEFLQESLGEGE